MVDLVGTCPKSFWHEWIAEGDPAGSKWSGETWGWFTGHSLIQSIQRGDRFYVVAFGRLRGYAPVTNVHLNPTGKGGAILRQGDAVAVTVNMPIPGFRGLRERWWPREIEVPFPNWRVP